MDILAWPSPNFGVRRHGRGPEMVVLHHTAMVDVKAALARLCDPATEVSAHYLICPLGRIYQMVDERLRAWHAGAGGWGRVRDVNSHSIGIELANAGPLAGSPPYSAAQMDALEDLLVDILSRHAITPCSVIGHSDMAPGRKHDPGVKFDWRRLALRGLSIWPEPGEDEPPETEGFLAAAEEFGYVQQETAGDGDGAETRLQHVLAAFRLRFRPAHRGPLDGADMAIMRDLARRYPCRIGLDPGEATS